jgi:hemerythrin superfamily protein
VTTEPSGYARSRSGAPGRVATEEGFIVDVTKILERDHRQVEDLFDKIEKAEGDGRMPFIDELSTSLRGHMELEEEVVYPAMEPVTGHEDVEEGRTEHELARKALEDVIRLAPDEPGFGAALDALEAGIKHHVDEEEDDIFPRLRKDGASVLEEMAQPFIAKRLSLGLPMDAEALSASSTKDELLEAAKKAGVEGSASMNKEELADALASTMS